jgi:hypothetical protein
MKIMIKISRMKNVAITNIIVGGGLGPSYPLLLLQINIALTFCLPIPKTNAQIKY